MPGTKRLKVPIWNALIKKSSISSWTNFKPPFSSNSLQHFLWLLEIVYMTHLLLTSLNIHSSHGQSITLETTFSFLFSFVKQYCAGGYDSILERHPSPYCISNSPITAEEGAAKFTFLFRSVCPQCLRSLHRSHLH